MLTTSVLVQQSVTIRIGFYKVENPVELQSYGNHH